MEGAPVRQVSDGKGGTRTEVRTETYTERVTDFRYKIDLTQFIYP